MTNRESRRGPWIVWALMMVVLVGAVGLSIVNSTFGTFVVIAMMMMIGYGTIGALVASRVPGSPIGWLMLTIGAGFAISGMVDEYATYTYITEPGALRGGLVAAWLSNWTFIVTFAPIPLILLLFPTGEPLSPRWRAVVRVMVAASVLATTAAILNPELIVGDEGEILLENPTGVEAIPDFVFLASFFVLLAGTIASVMAVIVRYRRSAREQRQQIRWLAFLAGVAAALVVAAAATAAIPLVSSVFFYAFFATIGVGMPAAIGYAILRHRLYDLDVVIKKTVIFGITVVLIMIAGVAMLLIVSGPLTEFAPDETAAVFAAGLVIGVLSWPLWRLARRIGDRLVYGGRSTPYEALTEFSERLAEAYATDDVLPRMAAILGESTRAAEARVWLRVGISFRPAAAWPALVEPGAPVIGTGDALPGLPGDRTVEVRHRGELLGALSVVSQPSDPVGTERLQLMHDLAAQAGLVLRNVRLIEELRASRQRLVAAQDAERRKLERNIHDGAQQQLVALGVKLRLADSLVDRDQAKAHEMITQLQTETQAAIDDLRNLARGIYPPLLADQGLGSALEAQARKSIVPVEIVSNGVGRFKQDIEAAVYFSCLEALQNIAKYAGASRATISLTQRNGSLEFSVIDDGAGFDPAAVERGTGLQGMADRIDAIGGSFTIESELGSGTVVRGTVPVV